MERFREFLGTGVGKAVVGGLIVAGIVALVLSIRSGFRGSQAAELSRRRLFICTQTLKTFDHRLKFGDTVPARSPHSGQTTGYPAELCFWTKDGGTRSDPTPVCLNQYRGIAEPTFCPDCGRLVIGHNPAPVAGATPPPTRDQYAARLHRGNAIEHRPIPHVRRD